MFHKRLAYALVALAASTAALSACGPSEQQIAEMTAAAATDTPVPTVTPAPTATPEPIDPLEVGDPERGRVIFEGGDVLEELHISCTGCHSRDGSEGVGPSLQGVSERAGDRVPGMSSVDYLRESIVDPSAYLVPGFDNKMEAGFGLILSEEDVNDLVAYLLTL